MIDKTHLFTIKRLVTDENGLVAQDAVGGQKRSFTQAARGTLPKTAEGRAVMMSHRERFEHGIEGQVTAWKLMFDTDPEIGLEDQVTFDFVPGDSRTVRILVASHARSADAAFYRAFGDEDTTA